MSSEPHRRQNLYWSTVNIMLRPSRTARSTKSGMSGNQSHVYSQSCSELVDVPWLILRL
jgi:hypothetical protein